MEVIVQFPGHHRLSPKTCTKQLFFVIRPPFHLAYTVAMLDLIGLRLVERPWRMNSAYLRAAKHSNLSLPMTSNASVSRYWECSAHSDPCA